MPRRPAVNLTRFTRWTAGAPLSLSGRPMLPATSRCGYSAPCSKTIATSRRAGGRSLTTRSPMPNRPARRLLQTRDEPQHGRLAAAGRAEQYAELSIVDPEIQVNHGGSSVSKDLADALQSDARHHTVPLSPMAGRSARSRVGHLTACSPRRTPASTAP